MRRSSRPIRQIARARAASPDKFHEISVYADLATCEARDPKGLYKKARAGEIAEFTGIDSPYESPINPDMIVDTQANDLEICVAQVVRYVEEHIKVSNAAGDGGLVQKEKALAG